MRVAGEADAGGHARSARWSPADYLLHGRYCEADTIAAALSDIRRETRSMAALLLAFRRRTLFHSLLLIDHEDADSQRLYQERLVRRQYQPTRGDPPFVRFDPHAHSPEWLARELAAHPPFSDLGDLMTSPVRVARSGFAPGEPNAAHQLEPASVLLLLFDTQSTERVDRLDDALYDLTCMVNASAPVVVHGNLAAEQDVEQALDYLEEQASGLSVAAPLGKLPQLVLDAALRLTGSSLGNIYFDTREGDELALEAKAMNARPVERIAIDDPDSVVAWVYSRRKPMVINDIRDFTKMHQSGYIDVTGDELYPYAELAVPIVQSSLGAGGGTVVGVINVEKVRPLDEGYYTYRDLTVLRLTASRLSLWRAHGLLSHFSQSLTQLTRNAVGVSPFARRRPRPDHIGPYVVPADAWGAKDVVDQTLNAVYDLTRSHSATVRLLTPDRRALVRFSAFPPARLKDQHGVIEVRDTKSVNAWVARHGRRCYLPNTHKDKPYAQYEGLQGHTEARPKTRSELCLPIFVSGRLVGTLNLESRHLNGYSDTHDLAAAVVEQVGLAIQHARRAEEQTVFSMSIATTANSHELLKEIDKVRQAADGREDLVGIAETMKSLIDTEEERRPTKNATTAEIVKQVLSDLHFTHVFATRSEPPFDVRHVGARALMLQIALVELFRNAYDAAYKVSLKCSLQWHATQVGGRSYLTLHIANPIRTRVPESKTNVLFRAPVRYKGERLHIGAYTAAALIRSLGGDIYVNRNEPPLFIVGVDLPADLSEYGSLNEVA
jgi:hypothetical protein